MKPYRILSLDGGGSWDIIQAMALREIYGDHNGHKILKQFDLVIANSGGSLVLAGLVEGLKPSEIVAMIEDDHKRLAIFSKLSFWENPFWYLVRLFKPFGPQYSAARKINGLNAALPNTATLRMEDIPAHVGSTQTDFVISTFDYYSKRAVFFRSNRQSMAQTWKIQQRLGLPYHDQYDDVLLHHAIHGSSNAPLNYFDKPAVFKFQPPVPGQAMPDRFFWDGGVGGFNNPMHAGLTEALVNGLHRDQICILSLGTASVWLPVAGSESAPRSKYPWLYRQKDKPTFIKDLPKMTESILDDPPDAATFMTYTDLLPRLPAKSCRVVRLSPSIQPMFNKGVLDVPKCYIPDEFKKLIELPMDATTSEDVYRIKNLASQWIIGNVVNQPVRGNSGLDCVIGHRLFEEGKKDWQKVMKATDMNELEGR